MLCCAAGIAERRVAAQKEGHRLARLLTADMWFATEDRLHGEAFFIGRAFKLEDGSCIYRAITDERTLHIAETAFTRGDSAIAVEWWVKTVGDDMEERTYERWQPSAQEKARYGIETRDGRTFFIVNSTELRMIDHGQTSFNMEVLSTTGPGSRLIRVRNQQQAAAIAQRTTIQTVRLPADTENNILARCWAE